MASFHVVLSGCRYIGISIYNGHFRAHQSPVVHIVVGLRDLFDILRESETIDWPAKYPSFDYSIYGNDPEA